MNNINTIIFATIIILIAVIILNITEMLNYKIILIMNIHKNDKRSTQMIEKLSKLNNLNSSINTIIFTTIIILVIVVILGLMEILNHKIMLIISVFGITILMIAGIAGIITTNKIEKTRDISQYTIYLDGNEVDIDKIDIKMYKQSYDDENLKIFLTNRQK